MDDWDAIMRRVRSEMLFVVFVALLATVLQFTITYFIG
jgi:hypothetical protein